MLMGVLRGGGLVLSVVISSIYFDLVLRIDRERERISSTRNYKNIL